MNLIFRLVAICLSNIIDRRHLDTFGASELDFRVWPFDLDLNIHMNNGRYLSIMDLGRLDLMTRLGLTKYVFKNKWMPVLASINMRYRMPLKPFQKFRLDTNIVWWDDKWFYIEQRFVVKNERNKDVVAAIGFIKGSFYDRKEKQTVPSSDIQLILETADADKPEKPNYITSWQNAEDDMRGLTSSERK